MGLFSDIWRGVKTVGSAVNEGLKKTKIISKLAPVVGTLVGQPGVGTAIGAGAGALGYAGGGKVGRVLKPIPMKKGGKVKKVHKKMHKKM